MTISNAAATVGNNIVIYKRAVCQIPESYFFLQ